MTLAVRAGPGEHARGTIVVDLDGAELDVEPDRRGDFHVRRNADAELFGESRLQTLLEGLVGLSSRELCARVVTAVQDYVGSAPQADDLTLTVLGFTAP